MRFHSGIIAAIVLLLLPVAGRAQRYVGVVILPPAGVFTAELSALSDALTNAVAALPESETVLLDANCTLIDTASAREQLAGISSDSSEDQLLDLALLLDLDELLVVRIGVIETAGARESVRIATRRVYVGQQGAAEFAIELSGLGAADIKHASEQFAVRLSEAGPPSPVSSASVPPAMTTTPEQEAAPPDVSDATPSAAASTAEDAQPVPASTPTPEPSGQPGIARLAAARAALAVGDLELARREADLALPLGAPAYELYMFRADLAVAQNQPTEQRSWLERAAAANPEAVEPLLRLGAVLDAQGLWQKAVECYDQAIALDPASLPAYTAAATVLTSRSRPKQAAEYLAKAAERSPHDNTLLMRLGDTYRQASMLAEAEEAYDLAARTAEPPLAAQIMDRLGDLYVSSGQFEEGFRCYAEAARLRGDNAQPLAQKRYEQMTIVADEAVMSALQAASEAFEAYYRDRTMPRERAYVIAEQSETRVAEVAEFTVGLPVPPALEQMHLRRQLFYDLAAEAIVALMTYLDTNLEQALSQYQTTVREACAEYEGLHKTVVK